jgi:aspartyl-tRNA(Asn)/glutamyl-tRNA(Gln) amidotransferase subunit B
MTIASKILGASKFVGMDSPPRCEMEFAPFDAAGKMPPLHGFHASGKYSKAAIMNLVQGATGPWETVIGLEVHAQVVSRAKLFSGAAVDFGAPPNGDVSLVDAAMPGMLPVLNAHCVEQAVRTGLGLKAAINRRSVFDRKNYFYPDLPAGYQISQYLQPIVGKGQVLLDMPDGATRAIGVTRLHLEQDAGKSLHDQSPTVTFVDLNRCGVALMEIVSEPDMRSAEEAGLYLRKLRTLLRYLGTCDGNMEEGSMRADVNVSVRRPGAALGTRCEVKNVNSIRFVQQAIEYEVARQIDILESGGKIAQETRLFESGKGITRPMRSKEEAHDYRYFPDPDLLPLELEPAWIEDIRRSLPELPDEKKARFISQHGLSPYDAGVLVADHEVAALYERVAAGRDAKAAANLVTGDFFAAWNRSGKALADFAIDAAKLGGLIDLMTDGTISGRLAKDVFAAMVETGKDAPTIVAERGLRQVTDTGSIEASIAAVMTANPDKVAEYRSGKDKLFGFFVGQVMKATAGKANPAAVNEILKRMLKG